MGNRRSAGPEKQERAAMVENGQCLPDGNVCSVSRILYCSVKAGKWLRASADSLPQFHRSADPAGVVQDHADECVPVCADGADAALCASREDGSQSSGIGSLCNAHIHDGGISAVCVPSWEGRDGRCAL